MKKTLILFGAILSLACNGQVRYLQSYYNQGSWHGGIQFVDNNKLAFGVSRNWQGDESGTTGMISLDDYIVWNTSFSKLNYGSVSDVAFSEGTMVALYSIPDSSLENLGIAIFDINGNKKADKFYNWNYDDFRSRQIIANPDSGFYIFGLQVGFDIRCNRLVRINNSGDTLWTKLVKKSDQYQEYCTRIATDTQGNVYIGGYDNGDAGFVYKYDNSGNLVWQKEYPNILIEDIVSLNDDIYIGGFKNSLNFFYGRLAKINTNGDIVLRSEISPSQGGAFYRLAVTQDQVIIGEVENYLTVQNEVTNLYSFDRWTHKWTFMHTFEPFTRLTDMDINEKGQIAVSIQQEWSNRIAIVENKKAVISESSIFPNPGNNTITLQVENPNEILNLQIVNLKGQEVLKLDVEQLFPKIDISILADGTYFFRINYQSESETLKFVKVSF